jgi:hypothetical protein
MTVQKPACIHRVLEGNIQELVLTEASRRGVDELFDMAEEIMADAHARRDMSIIAGRFLLDSRVGVLPLNYAFTRARMMAKKFPSHPQSRTALVFTSNPLVKTIDLVLRTFISLRLYGAHEHDQALAWLREEVPSPAKR